MEPPSPPNSDNEQPPLQRGVQQHISDGSSNQGSMQGASAGQDANLIHGNANRITQIKIIASANAWILASLMTVSCLGGIILLTQKSSTLTRVEQPVISDRESCEKLPKKTEQLRIAVANFDYDIAKLKAEARILKALNEQRLPDVEVCRTKQKFVDDIEAKSEGEKLGASIVIWGQKDTSGFEVFIKNVKVQVGYLTTLAMSPADISDSSFQTRDLPQLVTVMAAFSVSEIYDSKGQAIKARKTLGNALELAESRRLNENHELVKRVLSQAHFSMGLAYDAITDPRCNGTLDDCKNALQHFKRELELDGRRYEALLRQGTIYERLKQPSSAMAAYKRVIESNPNSPAAVKALRRRASLSLRTGHAGAAVKDLKIVCQLQPDEPKYLHLLGLAQIQAEEIPVAKKTFQSLKPYLEKDKALKTEVEEQLRSLAEDRKDLSEVIKSILVSL